MTATLISGKSVSEQILNQVAERVRLRTANGRRAPALAVVLVGSDPASSIYVRNKKLKCEATGVRSVAFDLPETVTQQELMALINRLNDDAEIDGILVQLPLPAHLNADAVIETIHPAKDVDGFHPYNIGRLALKMPLLRPCTPRGVMTLLESTGITLKGKHAAVIGASNIVGRPMALELLLARCTVTVCHSATQDLPALVRQADIVVAGVGRAGFVKGDWIKPGAVVIDVGINRLEDGRICGDVDFATASEVAGYITPVPGGVGLMTVATLMQNTADACDRLCP